MAISKVTIGNMALSNIGARSNIEDLTEDSAEAQAINLWYDFSRQQVLESFDWSFARKRLTLATHADVPPDGVWGYRYQYPSDALIIRYLQNPTNSGSTDTIFSDRTDGDTGDAVPYQIEVDDAKETKTILTNLESAIGVYTFDLETTSLFSGLFIETLAANLGYHVSHSLTGKAEIRKEQYERFLELLALAPAVNANEEVQKPPRQADWIRGRA
jgi:hypothetical protein